MFASRAANGHVGNKKYIPSSVRPSHFLPVGKSVPIRSRQRLFLDLREKLLQARVVKQYKGNIIGDFYDLFTGVIKVSSRGLGTNVCLKYRAVSTFIQN